MGIISSQNTKATVTGRMTGSLQRVSLLSTGEPWSDLDLYNKLRHRVLVLLPRPTISHLMSRERCYGAFTSAFSWMRTRKKEKASSSPAHRSFCRLWHADSWRVSFSHIEKAIMKNHGSEKTCCEQGGARCCRLDLNLTVWFSFHHIWSLFGHNWIIVPWGKNP